MCASTARLLAINVFGPPSTCPSFAGWHEEGAFSALEGEREPWIDSKRAPASPHAPNFLQLQFGARLLKPEEAACDASGVNRCFNFDIDTFMRLPKDRSYAWL